MKLNKITDLRDVICYWEHCAEERSKSPVTLATDKQVIVEEVIRKIASGSCSHPPTWCKELLRLY